MEHGGPGPGGEPSYGERGLQCSPESIYSPRADGGRHGSPASIRLSANCFLGLSKDQGGLFGNPKFPGVRNGLGFPKWGRPSLSGDSL